MKPGNMPMDIYRGDTSAWQFKLFEDESKQTPSDLTGVTAKAQIRDRSGGSKITDLTCEITLPNVILVTLSAEDSKALEITRGGWDLQLTYPDARVITIVAGGVTVTPDITDSGAVPVGQSIPDLPTV